MIRRLLPFLILIALSIPAAAQNGSFQQWCQAGGVYPSVTGIAATNPFQASYPQCQVEVFITGTTSPATIYSTVSGTPLTNPYCANADGSFLFFAAQAQQYDVVISNANACNPASTYQQLPATFTFADVAVSGSGGGGGGGGGSTPAPGVLNPAACGGSAPPSWCAGSDIGAWINAAEAALGVTLGGEPVGTLFIPLGQYTWTTQVNRKRGVDIFGSGMGATILNWSGSTTPASIEGDTGSSGASGGWHYITLNGAGNGTSTNNWGLLLGTDPATPPVLTPANNYAVNQHNDHLQLENWYYAIYQGSNTWSWQCSSCTISSNYDAIYVPATILNSGERMVFDTNSTLSNNTHQIIDSTLNSALPYVSWGFTDSHIDYNGNCAQQQVTLITGTVTGTFSANETITQTGTGATATYSGLGSGGILALNPTYYAWTGTATTSGTSMTSASGGYLGSSGFSPAWVGLQIYIAGASPGYYTVSIVNSSSSITLSTSAGTNASPVNYYVGGPPPNNSGTWTGITSGATLTPAAIPASQCVASVTTGLGAVFTGSHIEQAAGPFFNTGSGAVIDYGSNWVLTKSSILNVSYGECDNTIQCDFFGSQFFIEVNSAVTNLFTSNNSGYINTAGITYTGGGNIEDITTWWPFHIQQLKGQIGTTISWANAPRLSNTDMNVDIACGWFDGFNMADAPAFFGTGYVRWHNDCSNDSTILGQTAFAYLSNREWIRNNAAGTWGAWEEQMMPDASGNLSYGGYPMLTPNVTSQNVGFNANVVTWNAGYRYIVGTNCGVAGFPTCDMNSFTKCGFQDWTGTANTIADIPSATTSLTSFHWQNTCSNDSTILHQTLYADIASVNRTFARDDNGGTWTAWTDVTFTPQVQVYNGGVQQTGKIYYALQNLTAGAAILTFGSSFTYTSSSTFGCVCTDETAANACKAVPASATTVTLAGTSTDTLFVQCVGN